MSSPFTSSLDPTAYCCTFLTATKAQFCSSALSSYVLVEATDVAFFTAKFTAFYYRPHPKDGEGNVLTRVCLSVHRWGSGPGGGGVRSSCRGGGQVQLPGGVRSSCRGGVRSSCGGVRSSCRGGSGPAAGGGGQVQLLGGCQVQPPGGGGVSQDRTTQGVLATWRVVCLLRSRRRTFLFLISFERETFIVWCFCVLLAHINSNHNHFRCRLM